MAPIRPKVPKSKSAKSQHKGPSKKGKAASRSADPEVLEPDEILDSDEALDDPEEPEELDAEAIEAQIETEDRMPAPSGRRRVSRPEPDPDAGIDSEIRAISPTDPLRRYLDEVRRHPLLDLEEEVRLVSRLKDHGDIEAAKRLVSANLRLVVKIAFEYRSIYSNVMDLIQEGNIGLMKAVSKYDPTKGARLGYYSSWWIRSYILKYLLENFRLVKIGTTQAQKKLFYHLMREKERLEAQGLLAGPKLLAERLDVREKDVIEMEQRLSSRGSEMSIDAPISSGDGESDSAPSLGSSLADPHEAVDSVLAREEWLDILRERLPDFETHLDAKEKRILQERLLAEEPKTLQEIADGYGLTRERARQIEAKVLAKLRQFLKDDLE